MKAGKHSFLKQYFWDVDWSGFEPKQYPEFTMARILENGDRQAIDWLSQNFSSRQIEQVIQEDRQLSPKSANYWGLIYNINKNKIKCLSKRSRRRPKVVWKSWADPRR